jgi:FkbM family methyltransferase
MPSSRKKVCIGGQDVSILGSDTDRYFQNIEAFANDTRPLHDFVRACVPDGGVILDVGGNIGLTSIAMALAAPNSSVIAFEPSPVNADFFQDNTAGRERIELIRAGVGSQKGYLDFVIPPDGANAHVASESYQYARDPGFHPARLPVLTLDEFVQERELRRPVTLIKIDVEGFEPNVLVGAAGLIERESPLLWIEFNSIAINVAHGYSPMALALGLFQRFEVMSFAADGKLNRIPDAGTLVHNNIMLNHSVEDIVLKPRPGAAMPTVEEFTLPYHCCAELKRLRAARPA